ncbi:hypothetical protein [Luteolibacter sp. Populi]|uniref:hypothetical protein n=1 Tax=Luteolibacter sp. Populi TaxID=3230487 RepID=UPI0034651CE7
MELAVIASGMITPLGFNAAASLAALRAGIRVVEETNLWDPESGRYLGAGKVALPHWWIGLGKLADLAAAAIHECFEAAHPVPPREIPVLLGVTAADRPDRVSGLDSEILVEIGHRLGFVLHPESRVIPRGQVSAAIGLQKAAELITGKRAGSVIVAAVDSLLRHGLKDHYLDRRRLLTPHNSNGFSLGEAASAVLVTAAGARPRGDGLRVLAVSLDREAAVIESDEPLLAEGLTRTIRKVLTDSGLAMQDLDQRMTDLNGEHYRFKEMALAMGRFERKPGPRTFEILHPAEYIGDSGAAIGPILLAWALHAGVKGYACGPTTLCTLSNDNGERAAMIVRHPIN